MKLHATRFCSQLILAGSLSLAAALTSGCVAVAVGAGAAGAVAYIRGDLQATLDRDVEAVTSATARAITELRFFQISDQRDALSAVFVVRNAKDERITITIKKSGDNITSLNIRVGLFGDEELSRAIYDTIRKHLGSQTARVEWRR